MSGLLPRTPGGRDERSDRPETTLQVRLTEAERLGRWEVRAAQWRALELAREVFGAEARASMIGIRVEGAMRGLLKLDVPFEALDEHRARERDFMSQVGLDPLLSRVPLVYVLGPDAA